MGEQPSVIVGGQEGLEKKKRKRRVSVKVVLAVLQQGFYFALGDNLFMQAFKLEF